MNRLKEIIEAQRKGHENGPVWMVGQQLLDIAEREPKSLELLKKDLEVKEMNLVEAEKKIKAWADKNKKGSCVCVPPHVAETVLREFYGLPKAGGEATETEPAEGGYIDLESFFA